MYSAFTFVYSPRAGTEAAAMTGDAGLCLWAGSVQRLDFDARVVCLDIQAEARVEDRGLCHGAIMTD